MGEVETENVAWPTAEQAIVGLAARATKGNPRVMEAIFTGLQDDYHLVKDVAVRALARVAEPGEQRAIRELLTLLGPDEDAFVRRVVMDAMASVAEMGDQQVILALLGLVEGAEEWYTKTDAIEKLPQVTLPGDLRVVRALTACATNADEDEVVRRAAMEALLSVAEQSDAEVVWKSLVSDHVPEVREMATHLLEEVQSGVEAFSAFKKREARPKEYVDIVVRNFEGSHVVDFDRPRQVKVGMLKQDLADQCGAPPMLQKLIFNNTILEDSACISTLCPRSESTLDLTVCLSLDQLTRRFLSVPRTLARKKDVQHRISALKSLQGFFHASPAFFDVVLKCLGSPEPQVQLEAVKALPWVARHDDKHAILGIERVVAWYAAGGFPEDQEEDPLRTVVEIVASFAGLHTHYYLVKDVALQALTRIAEAEPQQVLGVLLSLLHAATGKEWTEQWVLVLEIEALLRFAEKGDERVVDAMLGLALSGENNLAKYEAFMALTQITPLGHRRVVRALTSFCTGEGNIGRGEAVEALVQLAEVGDPEVVGALVTISTTEPSYRSLKLQALEALAQVAVPGDKQVVSMLLAFSEFEDEDLDEDEDDDEELEEGMLLRYHGSPVRETARKLLVQMTSGAEETEPTTIGDACRLAGGGA